MDWSPPWKHFGKLLPEKGILLPSLVSPPLREAGCAPGPCAGWQRRQGQSRQESAFGSTGMWIGRRRLGRSFREAQGVSLSSHHPFSHPSATSWSRARPSAGGWRLRVSSEIRMMGILSMWGSFPCGDPFSMEILSFWESFPCGNHFPVASEIPSSQFSLSFLWGSNSTSQECQGGSLKLTWLVH